MKKLILSRLQQFSGVLGVVVIWAGISISMHRAGLGFVDQRPISYLGIDSHTSQLFSVTLLISASLFICFGFYVRKVFNVTNKFLIILVLGQIGQMIAAVAPYGDKQPMRAIHTYAAFTLAFSLPFFIAAFRSSQKARPYYSLYTKLLRLEQIAFTTGIGLFIFTKGIAPLGQSLPAVAFHAWIIAITIILLKNPETTESSAQEKASL